VTKNVKSMMEDVDHLESRDIFKNRLADFDEI